VLVTHLLPNYDEYFIGFKDRRAFGARLEAAGVERKTSVLSGHALIVNGQVVGGWKRTLVGKTVVIEPKSLIRLSEAERRAVGIAARRFGRFLEKPVEMRWR